MGFDGFQDLNLFCQGLIVKCALGGFRDTAFQDLNIGEDQF